MNLLPVWCAICQKVQIIICAQNHTQFINFTSIIFRIGAEVMVGIWLVRLGHISTQSMSETSPHYSPQHIFTLPTLSLLTVFLDLNATPYLVSLPTRTHQSKVRDLHTNRERTHRLGINSSNEWHLLATHQQSGKQRDNSENLLTEIWKQR